LCQRKAAALLQPYDGRAVRSALYLRLLCDASSDLGVLAAVVAVGAAAAGLRLCSAAPTQSASRVRAKLLVKQKFILVLEIACYLCWTYSDLSLRAAAVCRAARRPSALLAR